MWIRGAHLRGVLLPFGVATAAIAALAWYDLVWIPAQQQYIDQRNLRLVRTMGAQIKAKVDNFDQAIDHAIESYGVNPATLVDSERFRRFREYVSVFAPDLEIVEV